MLLVVLSAELALSARQQSQTFDEAAHIFAGYQSLKNFDFGIGPETAPLVRFVATIPLLRLSLRTPPVPNAYFKSVEYLSGKDFLYANDADALLFRARMAAACFTVGLAATVFLLAYSMCGAGPAFLALLLLIFEPNILAHGSLVTTDMGLACCLFLSVSCFYWYQKKPSALRLAGTGLAAGLCLGVKHSGILVVPILVALAFAELIFVRSDPEKKTWSAFAAAIRQQIASLSIVGATAVLVLWSLYGLRFSARPHGLQIVPDFSDFLAQLNPKGGGVVSFVERYHLLPESYLYGWLDVLDLRKPMPTFLLGHFYSHAQWFYFPAVFLIKSTLGFLLLCLLVPFTPALWRKELRRETVFLFVPPLIYVIVALSSGINYGVRHLLPVYPFLIVVIAFCAWTWSQRSWKLGVLAIGLLSLHAISSARAFPNYLPYANELWGGPQNAHRILADSNVDWGQGLKAMKRYIDERHINRCWFAYFGSVVADPDYYQIPCKRLPASFAVATRGQLEIIPQFIDGPVFISASEISGTLWDSDAANPYLPFRRIPPADLIANSILLYEGRFDVSQLAALTHENASEYLLRAGQQGLALTEAEAAVTVAPEAPAAHAARGRALAALNRVSEAQTEFGKARSLEGALQTGQ